MRRMLAQTRKELTQLLRDRLAMALVLVLPLFQLMLMGSSLSMIVRDLPIVVQDLDDSTASRELVDAFRASLTFRIVPWPTDRGPEQAFADNTARGVLIIPRNFARDLVRGVDSPVQMMVDGSDANTSKLVAGYAGGVARSFNASRSASMSQRPMVRTAIRFWYNPGLSSKKFYGPGIFVMAISMFPPLLATLAMAREGERKTILQVYVSSISAHAFLLGKIVAFMIVAFAESLLLLVFLFAFFGAQLAGDPTPFLVATLLYAFCVASFGTMIGAAIPNQAAAMQAVMFGGFLLVFMLSGLIFPLANVPAGLRWLSNLVWSRYYIEIVRDAFLQGGGWPATWFKVAAIGGIGALFYGAAWRRMRHMQLEV
jgi:ABC-2 type transport system permease protein